jgi:hypothetical protein
LRAATANSIDNAARLRNVAHPAILEAPRTAGDPCSNGQWPAIPERVAGYLVRTVAGSVWMHHLTLAAAVLSAKLLDPATVMGYLASIHTRFKDLFPALGISSVADWRPATHIPMYLRGEVLVEDTPNMRVEFRRTYIGVTGHLRRWRESLTFWRTMALFWVANIRGGHAEWT